MDYRNWGRTLAGPLSPMVEVDKHRLEVVEDHNAG